MERILELMKVVRERDNEISDYHKNRFAYKVQSDDELIYAIQTKTEMSEEVQSRFVDYLEELVSQFLN
jgi:hypothetical protein